MRALKTTTQLELAVRSNSVSASWGMFTFISLVQWMRSGSGTEGEGEKHGSDWPLVAALASRVRAVIQAQPGGKLKVPAQCQLPEQAASENKRGLGSRSSVSVT